MGIDVNPSAIVDSTLDAATVFFAGDQPIPQRIADRYVIESEIGRGGFGAVFRGKDDVTGRIVAVKVVRVPSATVRARLRRELAAMRLLRMPGVVELLDDGPLGDAHFLVMELVEGSPFPGLSAPHPRSWADIEGPTVALLDALERVHATGIVHRDLKPDNVLVRPPNRVVLLDFGLAIASDGDLEATKTGSFVGTPRYVAPEQIRGEPPDPSTDLYALGLMIYEWLAGELPHAADEVGVLFSRRMSSDPPTLRERNPEIPSLVSRVVERLLSRDRDRRFESAGEVAAVLRGHANLERTRTLPWLGSRQPLEHAAGTLLSGNSVAFTGPRGAGASRAVAEVVAAVSSKRRVAHVLAGTGPFTSLREVAPVPPRSAGLEDARALSRAACRAAFSTGTIVVVDDVSRVDPWSVELLLGLSREGPVLSTDPRFAKKRITLEPLTIGDLLGLFCGLERLLHEPSAAAALVFERSGGLPGAIVDLLREWTRRGLATPEGESFRLERASIDVLQRESVVSTGQLISRRSRPRVSTSSSSQGSDPLGERILGWVRRAQPLSTSRWIAEALDAPLWRVEGELERLSSLGQLTVLPNEVWIARGRGRLVPPIADEETAYGRLASVLPVGSRERLRALIAAGALSSAVGEAASLSARLLGEGNATDAAAVLHDVLPLVRGTPEERQLAAPLLSAAVAVPTIGALDRALHELTRMHDVAQVERLGRALRLASERLGPESFAALSAISRMNDARLEVTRLVQRLRVSRAMSANVLEEARADLEGALEAITDRPTRADGDLALALDAYLRGSYANALARYERVAASEVSPAHRLKAWIGAAASALEVPRLRKAESAARRAVLLAESLRDPVQEGKAWYLARAAAYRRGVASGVDEHLIEGCQRLGAVEVEAMILGTEAAFAFRRGATSRCCELASRVVSIWSAMGRDDTTILFEALVAASSSDASRGADMERLYLRAISNEVPGIGIQSAALLAQTPNAPTPTREVALRLASQLPRRHWHRRLDVLSISESLGRLGIDPSTPSRLMAR